MKTVTISFVSLFAILFITNLLFSIAPQPKDIKSGDYLLFVLFTSGIVIALVTLLAITFVQGVL